jgi:hydroxymethylglutaryl-CoA reductase
MTNYVKGFSKYSKKAKQEWLITNYFDDPDKALETLKRYTHPDAKIQQLHDEFIENTVSNFYLPFGIAPNFLINGKMYCVPMAIEESSVVAAAAKSANFWFDKGGFTATVISKVKVGHVHFQFTGDSEQLHTWFEANKNDIIAETDSITANMRKRGGGILSLELVDKSDELENYYQLEGRFDTCDSMGANFINSVLEKLAESFKDRLSTSELSEEDVTIVMCILSNYTPECIVRAEVSAPIEKLVEGTGISPEEFARKFKTAVQIAETQPYRAVTHNKGIMNGVDSVILATGNDFRAVEACAHAYASKDGQYKSLTHVEVEDGQFKFYLEMPLSLGTVGGITSLHPMVKFAHELMGNPDAEELMKITATVGLAQNFSALRSLTTTGIQQGHMKMHLLNVLNQLEATNEEKAMIIDYFRKDVPHYQKVVEVFKRVRGGEVLESRE